MYESEFEFKYENNIEKDPKRIR